MHDTYEPKCLRCSEMFNTDSRQPRLLQCFHTLCNECIQHGATAGMSFFFDKPSVACPLCAEVTTISPTSPLPINQVLLDIAEAAAASNEDQLCDFHNQSHPATYWCFECEQGMCDEGHLIHSRARGTKQHQTSMTGEQPQVIRKLVFCAVHGKELDLVCTHDSHSPCMVCISCVVTSHQSHPCVTTSDYFVRKQADVQALLERAKVLENRLAQGVEKVDDELLSVTRNTSGVRNSLNSFFTQMHDQMDAQQKKMLTELESTAACKNVLLQRQGQGLVASLEGVRQTRHQLEMVLEANLQAKALVLMEQLQKNLKVLDEASFAPQALAEMQFVGSLSNVQVDLIDRSEFWRTETTLATTNLSNRLTLSTSLPLSRFQITCTSNDGVDIPLATPGLLCGGYQIELYEKPTPQEVAVKLFGEHIQGSPITIPGTAPRLYGYSLKKAASARRTPSSWATYNINSQAYE